MMSSQYTLIRSQLVTKVIIQVKSRYYANPTNAHMKCNYLIDSDFGVETEWEPLYHKTKQHWSIEYEADIINKEKSPRLHRAFYIPYYYDQSNTFGKYRLLKSKIKPIVAGDKVAEN